MLRIDNPIYSLPMEPGPLISAVRKRAGLTQAALARRAGTSQPVISAYERGHRDPTYCTLRRLVQAAGARLELAAIPPGACAVSYIPAVVKQLQCTKNGLERLPFGSCISCRRR